jgi:hypothetical protein
MRDTVKELLDDLEHLEQAKKREEPHVVATLEQCIKYDGMRARDRILKFAFVNAWRNY